jgi:NAD(P)-dependent dehydrogenase (short-subunit alcohol dehydrogenase family)
MSEFRWAGKVALVTGGNSGIGAAITRRLLKLGLIVVALDRNIDDLQVCMQTTPYGEI